MNVKGILMNGEMVRAIQDGRKTVTRRVIKPQPEPDKFGVLYQGTHKLTSKDAPCRPGDVLYVREAWAESADGYAYKADNPDSDGWGWWPSIHMPRSAARIWLRVTKVFVERLQEISERGTDGAQAEGFSSDVLAPNGKSAVRKFAELWDRTVKPADLEKYGWAANPWVWMIRFERCGKPEVVET